MPALAIEKASLRFELCTSTDTLAELETVLLRSKFDPCAGRAARQAFTDGIRDHVLVVPVALVVADCPDPADNKFLALAVAADAELIVASDPHLTRMHPWREIAIMPPAAFLVGIG